MQVGCVVDPEYIYGDYIYVTTSSSGLNAHFEDYARDSVKMLQLEPESLVVDIGSNDGTLLRYFKEYGCQVLGVEPATQIAHAATLVGIQTYASYFNDMLVKRILEDRGSADVITINNTFANVDRLDIFTDSMIDLLSPEGVIIIESSYLGDMVSNMVFDFIYHEHYSYLSILPLEKFFAVRNMKLIGLKHTASKGGSMRYYFARVSSRRPIGAEVANWIERENKSGFNRLNTYRQFEEQINGIKNELIDELRIHNDATIVGYGASATSTTLIYHFGLQDYLNFLVDDNPAKIGTFSPGLHLPVKSRSALYDESVDIVLILAWRYAQQIISSHPEYKGRFIVPLPEVEIT